MTDAAETAALPAAAETRALSPRAHGLSPVEKAAIVLVALGPEPAAAILGEMDEQRISRFARTVGAMRRIPHETVLKVVAEFLELLGDGVSLHGGAVEVRKYLDRVLDEEAIERIMEDVAGADRSVWTRLAEAPESRLAAWLQLEHPQFATVILSRLSAVKAARILERVEGGFARDVVLRMSRPPNVDVAAIDRVAEVIERDFLSMVRRERGARKPADLIGGLMNHVAGPVREGLLAHIEAARPRLAQDVQRVMFTFADIADRVEPRDVALVVKAVEEPTLLTALKAAQAEKNPAADYLLGNISKRLAERLGEELEAMSAPRAKEGEAAQAELVATIREMARKGELSLVEAEEEE